MKKSLIAATAFLAMTLTAGAQIKNNSTDSNFQQHGMHHKSSEYSMHQRHHGMMMNLNLTDAQKQQVKDLNNDYRNQLKDLEKNENITLKDYRAKKAMLEQERKLKFDGILTSDQKNKIAQAKKSKRGKNGSDVSKETGENEKQS